MRKLRHLRLSPEAHAVLEALGNKLPITSPGAWVSAAILAHAGAPATRRRKESERLGSGWRGRNLRLSDEAHQVLDDLRDAHIGAWVSEAILARSPAPS